MLSTRDFFLLTEGEILLRYCSRLVEISPATIKTNTPPNLIIFLSSVAPFMCRAFSAVLRINFYITGLLSHFRIAKLFICLVLMRFLFSVVSFVYHKSTNSYDLKLFVARRCRMLRREHVLMVSRTRRVFQSRHLN